MASPNKGPPDPLATPYERLIGGEAFPQYGQLFGWGEPFATEIESGHGLFDGERDGGQVFTNASCVFHSMPPLFVERFQMPAMLGEFAKRPRGERGGETACVEAPTPAISGLVVAVTTT